MDANKMPLVDRPLDQSQYEKQLHVRVTNENDFTLSDMYDGVTFAFEPGKAKVIPADAANHIFNWTPTQDRKGMFLHTQRRWGWNTPEYLHNGKAAKFFDRIKIETVVFRLVEVTEPTEVEEGTQDPRELATRAAGGGPRK